MKTIETKQFKKGTKEPETFEIGGRDNSPTDNRTDRKSKHNEKTDAGDNKEE